MATEKSYKSLKGDEKRWRTEEGASTLRRYAELMADPEWLEASKKELDNQIKDSKKALDYAEMKK